MLFHNSLLSKSCLQSEKHQTYLFHFKILILLSSHLHTYCNTLIKIIQFTWYFSTLYSSNTLLSSFLINYSTVYLLSNHKYGRHLFLLLLILPIYIFFITNTWLKYPKPNSLSKWHLFLSYSRFRPIPKRNPWILPGFRNSSHFHSFT